MPREEEDLPTELPDYQVGDKVTVELRIAAVHQNSQSLRVNTVRNQDALTGLVVYYDEIMSHRRDFRQCRSLYQIPSNATALRRCELEHDHTATGRGLHVASEGRRRTWTTANECGRIEE